LSPIGRVSQRQLEVRRSEFDLDVAAGEVPLRRSLKFLADSAR